MDPDIIRYNRARMAANEAFTAWAYREGYDKNTVGYDRWADAHSGWMGAWEAANPKPQETPMNLLEAAVVVNDSHTKLLRAAVAMDRELTYLASRGGGKPSLYLVDMLRKAIAEAQGHPIAYDFLENTEEGGAASKKMAVDAAGTAWAAGGAE